MQITEDVQAAINRQINQEFLAFYRYLAAAAYFETTPYGGFAQWMRLQADEEHSHAMKFFDYIIDRRGSVQLDALPAPEHTYDGPLSVFEQSLSWEQEVTEKINNIYKVAQDAKDFATTSFLNWFVDEQVEEEKTADDWIERLKLAGDDPVALLRLDAEAATRSATPNPAA
ncbi:MAG: ferritin [Verrucomicrobiota bacterium]